MSYFLRDIKWHINILIIRSIDSIRLTNFMGGIVG